MGRAFLKGYARRRPLNAANLDGIGGFVAVRHIWLMDLHIDFGDRFGWGWMSDSYSASQLQMLRDPQASWLALPGTAWPEAD